MAESEKPSPAKTLNINVGILGHVDSGKTSLSRALSTIGSTACFDKHPQSKERGITLDLGFSSFVTELPEQLVGQLDAGAMQITLVDCPGHASLIRTIIGGAQLSWTRSPKGLRWVRTGGAGRLAPGAPRTVRTGYAYQPRAYRTYRVPQVRRSST